MINLDEILPANDDETYVKHTWWIVSVWILATLLVAISLVVLTL